MSFFRKHPVQLFVGVAVFSAILGGVSAAAAADRRAEASAKDALKRAASDYLSMEYGAGERRLEKALVTCAATRCTPATRAAVLRDLGTMQFRDGDLGTARKTWAEARRVKPDIALNPDYDAPDLRAAWLDAKGGGVSVAAEAAPSGDFIHVAAAAQKANTPLPIYVEVPGGSADIARVVVKYKSGSMRDWARLELKHLGAGWGGQIRCGDVTAGTLRYWVQGFDDGGDPVASSGDPKRPFAVAIKDEISTEPPHLPGKKAPETCGDNDCPPGLPGCGKPAEDTSDVSGEGEPEPSVTAGSRYARLWVGASLAVDFLSVPAGDDLCKLSQSAEPLNTANFYCTNPDGSDFPARNPAGAMQNSNITLGQQQGGHSDGGVGLGNVRVMLSADYALSPNLLAGARVGYVFNGYTGSAAVADGRALGAHVHLEARGTYLLGRKPLAHEGFAPMGFVGLGVSEFDHQSTSFVYLQNGGWKPVTIWLTDAPFFVTLGAGARYQFSQRAAFTAALRANLVIGGNGVLPTFGPEVGILYGF